MFVITVLHDIPYIAGYFRMVLNFVYFVNLGITKVVDIYVNHSGNLT